MAAVLTLPTTVEITTAMAEPVESMFTMRACTRIVVLDELVLRARSVGPHTRGGAALTRAGAASVRAFL